MSSIALKRMSKKETRFYFRLHKSYSEYFNNKTNYNYSNHLNWFKKKSKELTNFTIYLDKNPVGYIRGHKIRKNILYISIAINKGLINKNIGSDALLLYIEKVKKLKIKSLVSEIKKNNNPSKFFFLKNEFKKINQVQVNMINFNKQNKNLWLIRKL